MATVSGLDIKHADGYYSSSFGGFNDKAVYQDKLNKVDRRDEIKAALQVESNLFATGTNYSATSGSIPAVVPTVVDDTIRDLTVQDYPLANGLIPRRANKGLFADYVKRTALPTAKVKPEGAALDATSSTYTRAAKAMSYFYATGEVTGPLQAGSASAWKDMLQPEIAAHFRALKDLEEDMIINGNPTASDVSGSTTDESGFAGLIQSITTNTTNKSSAAITLDNIRDAVRTIREAKGRATLAVTDYKTLQDIKNRLFGNTRFESPSSIDFGVETVMFEGMPIIADLKMPTTATSRELLVLDTSSDMGAPNIEMRVLMEPTFFELAKTADSTKFSIKHYLTMIVNDETRCYRIYNLA